MLSIHAKLLFVALVFVLVATNAQPCYYPGGDSIAFDQVPCVNYVPSSVCCPTGWTCFSNTLCVATDPGVVNDTVPLGTSIRGTCTNPNWASEGDAACGNFCLSEFNYFDWSYF